MECHDKPIEIHLFSLEKDESLVELLTSVAYYHMTSENKLGLWHTVNFGHPWKPNSKCEFGLISLPYLDGSELESLNIKDQLVKFYWLIPITHREIEYKKKYGVDKLEDRFELAQFNYLNPLRNSVI